MTASDLFDVIKWVCVIFFPILIAVFSWMHSRVGKTEGDISEMKTQVAVLEGSQVGTEDVRGIVRDEFQPICKKQDQMEEKQDRLYEALTELTTTIARSGVLDRRDG